MKSNKSKNSHDSKTVELSIEGMTCNNCENSIKKALEGIPGVKAANADYVLGKAVITFDPKKAGEGKLISAIKNAGYLVRKTAQRSEASSDEYFEIPQTALYIGIALGIAVFLGGVYLLLKNFGISFDFPELSKNTSYALMFGIGLLTGFHCIAMCGGFVISYAAKSESKLASHIKYGAAKTLSYTIIGAIFGAIGSAIAFTPKMRGIAAILAGAFLVIFGLNMLGFLPSLRKLRLPQPKFISKIKGGNSPIAIGLLNGLFIACGPLQAMYIFAAGTGDVLQGALSLMFFGLGTLPVLLGFGTVASYLAKSATQKILRFSGVLVIILGLIMANRGLALSGSGLDVATLKTIQQSNDYLNNIGYKPQVDASTQVAVQKDGYQEIRMDVLYSGWSPDKFVLKKGVPVHWIIDGKEVTSCSNAIVVPKYNLQFKIKDGLQTIEFTPTDSGVVPWSCWMGMIPGSFIVVDDVADTAAINTATAKAAASAPAKSGSCGMAAGGGCGCGARR